jgi:subtilisin family serine protease
VVGVSSTGPDLRKAYYSNWGTEQTDVAAPGSDYWNSPDNSSNPTNLVLAAYPQALAEANGDLKPDGTPNTPFVVRDCLGSICGYYQYLQGTSMAAPHAVGVAALIVAQHGNRDRARGGLTLSPDRTESLLYQTASKQGCPQPRSLAYNRVDGSELRPAAYCSGPASDNGFYGHGIVNAYAAATN